MDGDTEALSTDITYHRPGSLPWLFANGVAMGE